jgi:hypothetical protein
VRRAAKPSPPFRCPTGPGVGESSLSGIVRYAFPEIICAASCHAQGDPARRVPSAYIMIFRRLGAVASRRFREMLCEMTCSESASRSMECVGANVYAWHQETLSHALCPGNWGSLNLPLREFPSDVVGATPIHNGRDIVNDRS